MRQQRTLALSNLSRQRGGDYSVMVNVIVWHHRGPLPDIKLISGWSMVIQINIDGHQWSSIVLHINIFYISSIQRLLAGGKFDQLIRQRRSLLIWVARTGLIRKGLRPLTQAFLSTFLHLFIDKKCLSQWPDRGCFVQSWFHHPPLPPNVIRWILSQMFCKVL